MLEPCKTSQTPPTAETLQWSLSSDDPFSENNYTFFLFLFQNHLFMMSTYPVLELVSWMRNAKSWSCPCYYKSVVFREVYYYQTCTAVFAWAASEGINLIKLVKTSPVMFNEQPCWWKKAILCLLKILPYLPPSLFLHSFISRILKRFSPLGLWENWSKDKYW